MPLYETVFIARQDIPAQEAEALADRFSGIVTESGGSVERREYWGLRTLAYRIKKNRKGHYAMLHIDASPDAVQEMERNMRLDEDVLRYLTIRTESLDENPSIIMQGRTAREERSRRDGVGTKSGPGVVKADANKSESKSVANDKRDGDGASAAPANKSEAKSVADDKRDGDGATAAPEVNETKAPNNSDGEELKGEAK